uniref:Uncharacterized protein n=1 Tax=Trichobilharzia regenti TaxID=157069 RepID=A0AA85ITW6_TRIRE|nr:unnamed protein product [Trichobilharzia regenti]
MHDTESRPNLSRFVNITNVSVSKPATFESDSQSTGVYQPPHLAPVFFEGVKSKSSAERAKLRAARFILEDVDLNESEDLPKEVYVRSILLLPSVNQFGCGSEENSARKRIQEKQQYEEENFVRLKTTKQEKRLQRSFLPGGLSDTSSRLRQMQILLQSSDEEMEYKPPPTKVRHFLTYLLITK